MLLDEPRLNVMGNSYKIFSYSDGSQFYYFLRFWDLGRILTRQELENHIGSDDKKESTLDHEDKRDIIKSGQSITSRSKNLLLIQNTSRLMTHQEDKRPDFIYPSNSFNSSPNTLKL